MSEMTEGTNNSQKEFWSGPSGQSWILHETKQDALLGSVARHVVGMADLRSGDRVLDIGCGTGALSELAATAVGEAGTVLATDISQPLLERAAARLGPFPQAGTLLADAAVAPWPEPGFDVALSRFGVMFFADPPAAFANIARALRSGGRMIFAAWGPVGDNPYWSIGAEVARAHLGTLPAPPSNAPGPMGLADLGYAKEVLSRAGLTKGDVMPVHLTLDYPYPAADLAQLMVDVGPARRVINAYEASGADVETIRAGIAERLGPFEVSGERVSLPATINLISAILP